MPRSSPNAARASPPPLKSRWSETSRPLRKRTSHTSRTSGTYLSSARSSLSPLPLMLRRGLAVMPMATPNCTTAHRVGTDDGRPPNTESNIEA